jgi:hypothetical protein
MLVNVEQERSSIKRKLLASCAMLGRDPKATLDRILVIPRSTFSARGDAWDAFKDLAKRKAFGLIVLDPRSRILRTGDANDEGAEAKVAEVIAELAELAACPIVIVSHLRKASGRDGRPTIEDISGSNQRGAAADVILALQATRGENDEVAASTLRCLKLRDDGGEEHPAAVRWAITREGDSVSLVVGDGAEAAPATKGGHLQLVELLRAKGALTARQLRDELNCSSTTLDRWITVAFAERRIKKDKKKHRGVERTVFMARAAAGEADRLASEARARPDRMTSGEAG